MVAQPVVERGEDDERHCEAQHRLHVVQAQRDEDRPRHPHRPAGRAAGVAVQEVAEDRYQEGDGEPLGHRVGEEGGEIAEEDSAVRASQDCGEVADHTTALSCEAHIRA